MPILWKGNSMNLWTSQNFTQNIPGFLEEVGYGTTLKQV